MVRSPKPPSSLEKTISSLAASDSASTTTSHRESGGVGVSPSGNRVPERSSVFFPQDGSLPFESSVRSPKPPSCLESTRASLAASDSASANTIHHGSGDGGLSMSQRGVPERIGGLFPQDGYLTFESFMRSPKPSSFLDISHEYLTTSARTITIHCDRVGGGVIPTGHRVPERSGGLFPLIGLLRPSAQRS